jgi:hypothetical protein
MGDFPFDFEVKCEHSFWFNEDGNFATDLRGRPRSRSGSTRTHWWEREGGGGEGLFRVVRGKRHMTSDDRC